MLGPSICTSPCNSSTISLLFKYVPGGNLWAVISTTVSWTVRWLVAEGNKRCLCGQHPDSPQSGAGRDGGRRGKNGENQQKHCEGARGCHQADVSVA